MTVRLIHQIDIYNGETRNDIWLLDGVGYREGLPLKQKDFEWIPGPDGGCWQAPNKKAVQILIDLGMIVEDVGNGKNVVLD